MIIELEAAQKLDRFGPRRATCIEDSAGTAGNTHDAPPLIDVEVSGNHMVTT
jgi:hypothetical protein